MVSSGQRVNALIPLLLLVICSCSEKGMDNYEKAEAYRKIGEYEKAVTEYQLAIEINPTKAEFYFGLAQVHKLQGNLNEALKRCKQATKLAPDSNDYLSKYNYLKGLTLCNKGQYKEAISFLRKAHDSPKDSLLLKIKEHYIAVSRREFSRGKYRNSEEALLNAQNTGQTGDVLFYEISKVYGKLRDKAKRIEYLKKAISKNQQETKYHFELGNIYYSDRNYELAINEFGEAGNYRNAKSSLLSSKQKLNQQLEKRANQYYTSAKAYFRKKSRTYQILKTAISDIEQALSILPQNRKYFDLKYKLLKEELLVAKEGNDYVKMAVEDWGTITEDYSYQEKRSLQVWIYNTSSYVYHVNPNHFTMVGIDGYSYHYDGGDFPAVDLQPGTKTSGSLLFATRSEPRKLIYNNSRVGTISREFPVRR